MLQASKVFVEKTITNNLQFIICKLSYWNTSFRSGFELLTRSKKTKYKMVISLSIQKYSERKLCYIIPVYATSYFFYATSYLFSLKNYF